MCEGSKGGFGEQPKGQEQQDFLPRCDKRATHDKPTRRFPEPAKSRRERKNGALSRLAWYRELVLAKMAAKDSVKPRERLLGAAYDLFARNGISKVGIDTILAKSGCAKASLYGNFDSKVDLPIAFLDRREAFLTPSRPQAELKRRPSTPDARLLAIFD